MLYDQVYTVGFFNNFHSGHLELLNSMRKKGKKLFVGLYDDQHMKISKNLKKSDEYTNIVKKLRDEPSKKDKYDFRTKFMISDIIDILDNKVKTKK